MTDRPCCGITEHTHDENCVSEKVLMCENEDHEHTDECYATVWSCGLEEHTHTSECYPDHNADVETSKDWEATLPVLSGYPVSDIVRIAESQLGYAESVRNVEFEKIDDDNYEMHGYTRYGEFVGQPYCYNWSTAFVSFCLNYSGFSESNAPRDIECEEMRQAWEEEGLFFASDAHNARPGDLVFIDRNGDGAADSVGIVTYSNANCIRLVEGDSNDRVEEIEISLPDETILGYVTPLFSIASDNDTEETTTPDVSETTVDDSVETSESEFSETAENESDETMTSDVSETTDDDSVEASESEVSETAENKADETTTSAVSENSGEKVETTTSDVSETSENDADETASTADSEIPSNSSNGTSASSWFESNKKSAQKSSKKSRKAPSRSTRSGEVGDTELDDYITDVAASGTIRVEENLYQTTLELH